ncbi:DegT/DnrJ/EryC1/StrS family aminotransferase [Terriglobus saanensis]|uniref:Glutamine--scyllo-inositol transaminase n=1 Tax=Terriglobus saanensis (strain ATCC BAA-1853 / DSM 23119 / SP1PR4) TaxID=401053 RepID=E8UYG6_TERSS|nr:DegT/DnrJ/EryC1/StrS family aminotransferase [Terriglobus saanensis]ADV82054.1 Glutamine--scyllo-inositol transaminase [Terriglobus saanensis SP1PR4]
MFISPRYNYPAQFGESIDSLMSDLRAMLLGGKYILTTEVRDFEESFAAYNGVEFARGVNSGTDALVIALLALGIGRGDEVITHANSFHATAAAIDLVGATPVLVDADEDTYLMDVTQVADAITERTRAIIPVHLFGKPTPMGELLKLAKSMGVVVVEDAAQAHGAVIDGRRAGSFGVAGCFSFHPSKNLAAAGDGGAIISDDPELMEKVDQFRALGQRAQNEHVEVGFNSKLDAIQARILSCKLERLDAWNSARAWVAERYRSGLAGLPLSMQRHDPDEIHVYHLFQVRTKHRDALLKSLVGEGVDAVIRYPTPIHLQPAFAQFGWKRGQFPVAESLSEELICLPLRPDMEEGEIDYVTSKVHAFYESVV